MDPSQKLDLDIKTPFWSVSGLLIIIAFMIWAQFSSANDQKNLSQYIESPKVGDVIIIPIQYDNKSQYGYAKIEKIDQENVLLRNWGSMFLRLKQEQEDLPLETQINIIMTSQSLSQ